MKRILVLAGNYNEYMWWLRENRMSPHAALYIVEPMMIAGFTDGVFVKVGTWYIHKWADEVVARLKARGFSEQTKTKEGEK